MKITNSKLTTATVAIFVLLAIFYFLPIPLAHKISLPMLTLSIAGIWLLPWPMKISVIFSFLGDYAGSCHIFLSQMGFFAAAHLMMIVYFVREYAAREAQWRRERATVITASCGAVIATAVAIFAFINVIPAAPQGVIRTGTAIYCILISGMFCTAIAQRQWLFTIGAALFVFSDMILGWNKFVSPIAAERYLIMVPYYLGQLMIFLGAATHTKASSKRLPRAFGSRNEQWLP